jgi:hypothetical protein
MIRLLNHRPRAPLCPVPVRLGVAVFFGGVPLLAWWRDGYDLIGPGSGPPPGRRRPPCLLT